MRYVSIPLFVLSAFVGKPLFAQCAPYQFTMTTCEYAREVANAMAPNLPQRLSENMVISSIFSLQNLLNLKIHLLYDEQHLEQKILELQVERQFLNEQMVRFTKNGVCTDTDTAAFVRAGGVVRYLYAFVDGTAYMDVEISDCDR